MRHLSVPRQTTQRWVSLCRDAGWLADTGVAALDEERRGVPLLPHAPSEEDPVWEGHVHVEHQPPNPSPVHWTDRLPAQLRTLPSSIWPSAYEIQGDVLMVKVEGSAEEHQLAMAKAMLEQLPNVRLVCADNGVSGDFRVRDLRVLASRDGTLSTQTRVRESGVSIWVDPGEVYFSARLSTQRAETCHELQSFSDRLGRSLVVADPYAGVGPAFASLLQDEGLVGGMLAGDLNPNAVVLLQRNIEHWSAKRQQPLNPCVLLCEDARQWGQRPDLAGQADVLLVNLPHDSLDHLPSLMPVLRPSGEVLVRGWAIVERNSLNEQRARLESAVKQAGGESISVRVDEVKGFSSSKCFIVFQSTFTRK